MKNAILGLLLLLASAITGQAMAAEPAVITFVAPTKYVDNSDITVGTAITYNVYQGVKGAPKTKVATITQTSVTITTGLVAGTEYCFDVTSVINGVESASAVPATGNTGCKLIPFLAAQPVVITVK